jgi:hypothetical protein
VAGFTAAVERAKHRPDRDEKGDEDGERSETHGHSEPQRVGREQKAERRGGKERRQNRSGAEQRPTGCDSKDDGPAPHVMLEKPEPLGLTEAEDQRDDDPGPARTRSRSWRGGFGDSGCGGRVSHSFRVLRTVPLHRAIKQDPLVAFLP